MPSGTATIRSGFAASVQRRTVAVDEKNFRWLQERGIASQVLPICVSAEAELPHVTLEWNGRVVLVEHDFLAGRGFSDAGRRRVGVGIANEEQMLRGVAKNPAGKNIRERVLGHHATRQGIDCALAGLHILNFAA
jgi:hypothetical protein